MKIYPSNLNHIRYTKPTNEEILQKYNFPCSITVLNQSLSTAEVFYYDGEGNEFPQGRFDIPSDYLFQKALLKTDTAPTIKGLYPLLETGIYTNLGGINATYGKLNFASFDGTTWSKVEVAVQNGKSAYEVAVDNGFVGTEEEWLESLGGNPNVELALSSFLANKVIQQDVITMPGVEATNGKYLLPSLTPANAVDGEWGYINTSELIGYDSITVKGDMVSLGQCAYLVVKKANGSFQNLVTTTGLNEVTVPIDHTAQRYIYSRFKGATFFFKDKIISKGTEDDSVKKYIDEKTENISVDGIGVFRPENYGAIQIDPKNPDLGIDCTKAFNDMFEDMFTNYPTINSYRVIMNGVYRIGGAPIQNGNSQLNIPFLDALDWNFKSVSFIGLQKPSMTDRGNHVVLNPLLGSGFYSSYIDTSNNYKALIRVNGGTNFGLRVGHVYMENISIYIKTHDENNVSIVNNMCGLLFNGLSSFSFTDLLIQTTTAGLNTAEPTIYSIGLYLPSINNMASVYGNSLKVMGFGTGAILTEHLNLNHLVAVFNKIGVSIEKTYPINIGNATLEHNQTHVKMDDKSCANFGVLQTEDFTNNVYWFQVNGNMVKGPSTSRLTISQVISHVWGGASTPLTYDSAIKLRYLMDEYGNSKLT